MKALGLMFVFLMLGAGAAISAGVAALPRAPAASAQFIEADWQPPPSLPRRFRNHCAADPFSGRRYCADHCGSGYQFYDCAHRSFGCCRIGFGYCDWSGLLRCHP